MTELTTIAFDIETMGFQADDGCVSPWYKLNWSMWDSSKEFEDQLRRICCVVLTGFPTRVSVCSVLWDPS
jgi:hypothetical protein